MATFPLIRVLTTPDAELGRAEALAHLTEALAILDEINAPGEIGSMLDHAIGKLEQAIGHGVTDQSAVRMLIDLLEREMAGEPTDVEPGPKPWELQPN